MNSNKHELGTTLYMVKYLIVYQNYTLTMNYDPIALHFQYKAKLMYIEMLQEVVILSIIAILIHII